jgi:tetratricopeptide (TPR) repeat protein
LNRARTFLIPALLVLIGAGVYLQTLSFGFVGDDPRQIVMAQSRFTWDQVPGYFTTDVWSYVERVKGSYYRPVFLVWLLINYQLFGLNPALWHASTVAMHILATLLLFVLARRLSGDALLAGIAALLFVVHPAHVEGVAWISGVTEPLLAVLSIGAILCQIQARENPARSRWWNSAAVALFALDGFSKETAIVLPLILFADQWLYGVAEKKARTLAALRSMLPYLQVTVVYVAARIFALGRFGQVWPWPRRAMLETIPSAALFYLRHLLWPWKLGMFYQIAPVTSPGLMNFAVPVLLCLAALGLLAWIALRDRVVAFFVALLVVPLLPVLDIANFSPQDFVHDRYLYLPSAGLCVLAAIALRRLPRAGMQVAIVLPVAALLAWTTVRESRFWIDDDTMERHSLEVAPDSVVAARAYAGTLVVSERYPEALPVLLRVAAVFPKDPDVMYALGVCHYRLGDFEGAAIDLRRVIALEPDHPHAHLLLGMAEAQMGHLDAAEADMREALRIRPRTSAQYSGYHAELGSLLERKGDLRGALAEYEAELKENQDPSVLDRAQAVREKLGSVR